MGGVNIYGNGNNAILFVDPFGLALYAFDGTNNDYESDIFNFTETNVGILHSIYRGPRFYEHGVGTRDGAGNPLGLVGGYGGEERLDRMMGNLRSQISGGDSTVHVIGFSRGAALAREFVNRVADEYPCLPIEWLGLFDTVASFGLGGNDIDLGIRLGIPDAVDRVIHLTAEDEFRYFFPLASIRQGPGRGPRNRNWVEIPLPGAHSDIGGGYRFNRGIANLSLFVMHQDGVRHGVPFGPIPDKYLDLSEWEVHDSRWLNDRIGLGRWLLGIGFDQGGFQFGRGIFYHP